LFNVYFKFFPDYSFILLRWFRTSLFNLNNQIL